MRKNSRDKSWVAKKIGYLMKEEKKTQKQAVAIALGEARKYGLVRNPAEIEELRDEFEDAVEAAKGAHGRPVREELRVKEKVQYRENLAVMGELEEIEVYVERLFDGDFEQLEFSRKKADCVRLAFTPDRKQLILVGGDQKLDDGFLRSCDPKGWGKDKVSVGWVYSISYWADKHHLEGSSGKLEPYQHNFGEQTFKNPNGKQDGSADYDIFALEEKLEAGLLPELVYDRLNEGIELVGGGYRVKNEGIWD